LLIDCVSTAKLTDEDRKHLASALEKRYYEVNQDIITQGDHGKEFYILMEGVAEVLRIDDEKNAKKVAELHGGDYFGEAALLNNDRRQATIRAKEKCYALSLDAEAFHKLFGKNKLNVHFAKRQAIAPEPVKNLHVNRDPELYKKSDELKQFLAEAMMKTTKIFKEFESSQMAKVVDGMWKVEVKSGESIIKQGDPGDNFYVVEQGEFDIFKNGSKVNHAGKGICFGELALIFNAPRQASVTAVTDSIVWAVDRHTFRENLKKISQQKLEEYEKFLITVPILRKALSDSISFLIFGRNSSQV
jgi:CRP-like cAMP-binding protein